MKTKKIILSSLIVVMTMIYTTVGFSQVVDFNSKITANCGGDKNKDQDKSSSGSSYSQ